MRRLTRGYAAAVALGAVTLLGACTPPPATDPPNTPTSAPSSSTTGTAPPTGASSTPSVVTDASIPAEATANTPDGAVAFVNYFAKRANVAYDALEPQIITNLSQESCKTCRGMVDAISGWKTKNQRYVGLFINPTNAAISAFPKDGTAKVLVTTKTDGGRILDANGSTVSTFPGESGNLSIAVVRVGDAWSVSTIQGTA